MFTLLHLYCYGYLIYKTYEQDCYWTVYNVLLESNQNGYIYMHTFAKLLIK